MIEVKNVCKSFGNHQVLDHISLTCQPGRIYGIVGYNGSGKTVLFKCILGFLHCDQGEIVVDGKRIGRDIDILTSAGAIIEEPGLLRGKTAYQNLLFLYTLRNRADKKKLFDLLREVDLDPESRKPVGKFSLGMKQRLAIAQAIMEDPPILVLDEPMNGLDKAGVQQMRALFLQQKEKGKTILLASHNREDINALCDEVYEIDNGALCKLR